ncbi:MAG: CpcT/CpeT family chromophore lyase [Pseudomonadota bacterium]
MQSDPRNFASRLLFALLLLPWLAACNTTSVRGEAALNELVALLPGSYDNIAQARSMPDHSSLRLVIAPVQAPLVGDHVLYMQEMAGDDPRRVLTQRLFVVDAVPGSEMAAMTQLDFIEPSRWRDGQLNRDLFRSLLTTDLRPRAGCEMLWKRADTGFAATNNPQQCRGTSRETGETVKVEQRIEVDGDGVSLFEVRRDALGAVIPSAESDPHYRFTRRADTPW